MPIIVRVLSFCLLCWQLSHMVEAKAESEDPENDSPRLIASESPFQAKAGPMAQRGTFWRPALSLLLPGFDQHLAHQFDYGLSYSGLYLLSSWWAEDRHKAVSIFEDSQIYRHMSEAEKENLRTHDERYKQRTLANQFILFSGGLSAYHSFRTSVRSHQAYGGYEFLRQEESPGEILLAPFRFEYLTRPTTLLPLALISGLAILDANTKHQDYRRDPLNSSDLFYTGMISYNAGTYEEAMFRGWLMPLMMEGTGSEFWSNFLQSGIFAAAHLNQISMPYTQFALGFYLGWLTQQSDWTISESIFIHAWWDVVALSIQYSNRKQKANKDLQPVVYWLPALKLAF